MRASGNQQNKPSDASSAGISRWHKVHKIKEAINNKIHAQKLSNDWAVFKKLSPRNEK